MIYKILTKSITIKVPLGIIVAFPVIIGVTSFLVSKSREKKRFEAIKREFELSNGISFDD
jgi:hypothetical protein